MAVVPPFIVEDFLEEPAGGVFEDAAENHTEEENCNEVVGVVCEKGGDEDGADAPDGNVWADEESAVAEFAFVDTVVDGFGDVADGAIDEEKEKPDEEGGCDFEHDGSIIAPFFRAGLGS